MTQKIPEVFDVVMVILREFGFPCLVLMFIGWACQRAAAALHKTVLIPVVSSHTTFLKATSDTLATLSKAQERQADTLDEIAAGQREIQGVLVRVDRNGSCHSSKPVTV